MDKASKNKFIIKILLPVALVAAGFSLKPLFASAFPLAGEEVLGGYKLTVIAEGRVYEFTYPEIDLSMGRVYLKNCEDRVEGIFLDTVVRPENAEVKISPEKEEPFTFKSEKMGKGIDRTALIKDIDRALNSRTETVRAKNVTLSPEITVAQLKKYTFLRSDFATDYSSSSAERKHNIALAAKLIGGHKIECGNTFSFNTVVGERSEKRGFKTAKIISGGEFVDGLGGGVCQVSTTVYNAALTAGYEIAERHRHSLPVSYIEPSFDAMVNSGTSDLKVTNSTGGDGYIVAYANGSKIRVRIYGLENNCRYKRVNEIKERISPPKEKLVDSEELFKGESKILVYAKAGIKSRGYLERYENGKMTKRTLLSEDEYSPVRGVVLIGIAEPIEDENET